MRTSTGRFSISRSSSFWTLLLGTACAVSAAGCGGFGLKPSADRFGRTYFIEGAGNWGFGVRGVRRGLEAAGYHGNVMVYRWSPTLNPALDQTVGRPAAKANGAILARQIARYQKKYPDAQVNIIALSAGTGVAVWACEDLEPPAKVDNLILLGSSLSTDYDMSEALENIRGQVWVYYSPYDRILRGPVRTLGTIDGKLGTEPAGLAGLYPNRHKDERIHNVRWTRKYERYGWSGAHTDATSEPFVRLVLSRHILHEGVSRVSGAEQADAVARNTVQPDAASAGPN